MKGPSRPNPELLHVRVTPRASKNEVVGWESGALRVRVTAPPVDGLANRAVLTLLAKAFGVPQSSVILVGGEHGRDKLVRLEGWSAETLTARWRARRRG
jgi:uncharacterized protein (TIGR00251 family)